MGSTRFSILGALAITTFLSADAFAEGLPESFENETDIASWATGSFFGGFELKKLSYDEITVIAVIGVPTSGIPTSELYLYQLFEKRLKLVAYRPRMQGIVKVKSDELCVCFYRDDVTVLSVAWHSLDNHWE